MTFGFKSIVTPSCTCTSVRCTVGFSYEDEKMTP